MSENKSCSSRKEQRFRVAVAAKKLMRITIRNTMHSPKKFRPTYIHYISKYTIEIFENVNLANKYKDIDIDYAKDLINKINVNIILIQEIVDVMRLESGINLDDSIEILNSLGEFIQIFRPWSEKFVLSCDDCGTLKTTV